MEQTNPRVELYNLKNADCQKVFKEMTSCGDSLSAIFDNEKDLNKSTKLFRKQLDDIIKWCFRKIRVCDK